MELKESHSLTSNYTTKILVIKTVWYWQKNRNKDQWNRMESPEINPCTYGQLICDKGSKNIWWRKDSLFNKWCQENWKAKCKRMKVEYSLIPYTKLNSKWIKILNVRPDTIKLLKKNISRTLLVFNCSNRFFNPSPKVMEIKTKISKWDLINSKAFAQQRKPETKWKDNPQNGSKYLQTVHQQEINQTAHAAQ